jgi:hypothetical protein
MTQNIDIALKLSQIKTALGAVGVAGAPPMPINTLPHQPQILRQILDNFEDNFRLILGQFSYSFETILK